MRCTGHTLVEVITVVLILSILACIAVPRINFAAVTGVTADAAVQRIVTDLRRACANAILHAARNPAGFALIMTGGGPYDGYRIVDLHDSTVIGTAEIHSGIRCSGGRRFEFGPLGNLRSGSGGELRIATDARTYEVTIVPATGAVKWVQQ